MRIEQEFLAKAAFARNPKPVRQDHVGAAADQRDLAGFGGRQLVAFDVEVGLLVEPVGFGDGQLPPKCSRGLDGEAQLVGGFRPGSAETGKGQTYHESENEPGQGGSQGETSLSFYCGEPLGPPDWPPPV